MPDNPQSEPPKPSRRSFLLTTGSTAAAGVVGAYLPVSANIPVERKDGSAAVTSEPNVEGSVPILLRINGEDRQLRVDPRTTLLDCLRETVVLTGTKKGCDHGQCGACTVHVNGRRVNSCLTLALMHDGEEITTIEGLGTPDALHPREAKTRIHAPAIHVHRAGAALTVIASLFRAGERDGLTNAIEQRRPRVDTKPVLLAVDPQ